MSIESIFKHEPRDGKFIELFSPDSENEVEVYIEHNFQGISFFLDHEKASELHAALGEALK
jgi:hypothetical protein